MIEISQILDQVNLRVDDGSNFSSSMKTTLAIKQGDKGGGGGGGGIPSYFMYQICRNCYSFNLRVMNHAVI